VIGNPALATFAAFGSFAMLLLVDFGGPMRDRLQAQAALAAAGVVLVCLGTLASRSPWLGGASMAIVAFGILFAGVVSSVLAGATLSLLLAFILPVSLAAPASAIPDRLEGWGLASGAAFVAVAVLWPAPARNPLRGAAGAACRALAARLRSDAAFMLGGPNAPSAAEHDEAVAGADAAAVALQKVFFATPYRPTGLSTPARTVVRLVDELGWVHAIAAQSPPRREGIAVNPAVCAAKSAAAEVLERSADLLDARGGDAAALDAAVAGLRNALAEVERSATLDAPAGASVGEFVSALDPSFRAQELSFAVSQIAVNVALTAAAERRSWLAQVLGRQPGRLAGALSVAQERAAAHVERHSVWLHNSVRGAVGLGLAVAAAELSGVQHAFWVVLGTLSVLRSNALSTGQNALRSLVGTTAGFVIGAGVLLLVGTNTTLLWFLLAPAILFAGFAPAAISFAAGQAAFTLALVILFNIIQPAGWRVGLVRVEDIAFGCAVSVGVGLLFWPRGAASALGEALADAYTVSARYLSGAVRFGMSRCDAGTPFLQPPTYEAAEAAAAARRLDDAFRGFLAERGAKSARLAEVTGLVTGVAGLRLAADAVLDIWERDDGMAAGNRAEASRELLSAADSVDGWFETLAAAVGGHGEVPDPLPKDESGDGRLVDAIRRDLTGDDGNATAVAVRMIWTGDHLDAARRLQGPLVGAAREVAERRALAPLGAVASWLKPF
jgi:uncharacterized membrane protein YccC